MSIQLTDNDVKQCILDDGKTVMATMTNHGYLLYTLNMLKSLVPFGLDKKILIVCIDTKGANVLRHLGYNVYCVDDATLTKFCSWNTKGYDKICYLKLELIHRLLSLDKNILLVDGDIVFLKNPLDDIMWWIQEKHIDVHIQNDSLDNLNKTNMCTGYMLIKSNDKMIDLYDCVSEKGKKKYMECVFDNNDQSYFNKFVKPNCTFQALTLMKYPNGQAFYNQPLRKETAVLVHFNWVHGHIKMAKIKEHKMWLLTPEEEEVV
jgi:Nucleotide-diphospho-sugar transferase